MNSGIGSQAGIPGYHTGNGHPPLDTPHRDNGNGQRRDLLDERYLTVHELADILRLSPMTVYRAVEDQELEAVRISSHSIRIPENYAEGYLQRRRLPVLCGISLSHTLLREQYLTVQELAGVLRVSVMTVYRILKTGMLEAVQVAPHVIRIVKTSAEKYMRSGMQNIPQATPARYSPPPALPLPPAHMRPGPARFP